MSSTTLVTFLVQVPQTVTTVELLGSWDNFRKPYRMERDSRTGPGHWRGCHSFTDIICDGDLAQLPNGRNGGLKMGGMYWYYYRLDDDVEYHNPVEASTTSCPLLPGQLVNVLDVPVQLKDEMALGWQRPESSSSSLCFTLNPEDKYLTPHPPEVGDYSRPPTPAPCLDDMYGEHEESSPEPARVVLSAGDETVVTLTKQLVDLSIEVSKVDIKERFTKSAPGLRPPSLLLGWPRLCRARSAGASQRLRFNSSREQNQNRTNLLSADSLFLPLSTEENGPENVTISTTTTITVSEGPYTGRLSSNVQVSPGLESSTAQVSSFIAAEPCELPTIEDHIPENQEHSCPFPPEQEKNIANACTSPQSLISELSSTIPVADPRSIAVHEITTELHARDQPHSPESWTTATDFPTNPVLHDPLSHRSSSLFSPALSISTCYTGSMSPFRLSQPETPVLPDFANFLLEPTKILDASSHFHNATEDYHTADVAATTRASAHDFYSSPQSLHDSADRFHGNDRLFRDSGFSGYSVSEAEHASTLTLRHKASGSAKTPTGDGSLGRKTGKDFIDSWNDGAENHPKTALQELFEELGYLGRVID